MARIAGVNVPTNKRVHVALTYVHGIGLTSSKNICKKVGISEDKRINKSPINGRQIRIGSIGKLIIKIYMCIN